MAGGAPAQVPHRRRPVAALVILGWVVGLAATLMADVPADAAPAVEWGACPVPIAAEDAARVRCGVLTVPENRANDTGRTIELPFAVVASRSPAPRPDPVVLPTMGGPGSGSFSGLWLFLEYDWATGERDGIVLEQRGDLLARPSLQCPELDARHTFVDGRRLAREALDEAGRAAWRACHDRLTADGVDLSAYSSAESAADLADLRAALGYDGWNLYGLSYGTRLAQTVLREHPDGLRSVVLDGVVPLDVNLYEETGAGFERALGVLAGSCRADPECAASYPDLEQDLAAVLSHAGESPLTVSVRAPWDGSTVTLALDDRDLAEGLFETLYDDYRTRALPFLIDRVARGDTDVLVPLVTQQLAWSNLLAAGLTRTVDCVEELPFYGREPARRAGLARHLTEDRTAASCSAWPVAAASERENEPVSSDVPALLLSGDRDPITPPAFARQLARSWPAAVQVEFPHRGHGAVWHVWGDPCPGDIARRFLDDPAGPLDTACAASTPPGPFLTPRDLHPGSAWYRLDAEVLTPRDPVQLSLVGACVAVLGGTLGWAAVSLVRRRGGGRPGSGGGTGTGVAGAAALASAVNLAFVGSIVWVLLGTEPLILGFGTPTAARPVLLAMAALAAASTLALGVVLARSHGAASRRGVVPGVVAFVAAVTLAGWVLARGLVPW